VGTFFTLFFKKKLHAVLNIVDAFKFVNQMLASQTKNIKI